MATAPSPNDLTRQQLDELDSLLQRMLALPLNPVEAGPPAASLPELPDPEAKNWRADPPSLDPIPIPHLLAEAAREQAADPVMVDEVEERPVGPLAPRVPVPPLPPIPVSAPDPVATEQPAVYFPGSLNPFLFGGPTPPSSLEPVAHTPGSPAPMVVSPLPAVSLAPPPVPVPARPPVPLLQPPTDPRPPTRGAHATPLDPIPPTAPPPAPVVSVARPAEPVPLPLAPLVALNRGFDAAAGLFGLPGRVVRSGFGKNVLGLAGLGLLAYTAAHVAQLQGWVSLPVPLPWPR